MNTAVRLRKSTAGLVLEAMRPRQWVKNVFVLSGLVFAGETFDAGKVATVGLVFVAFCLASGAAYLVNDVVDAESDRHAPRTASRPIARGDLAPRTALLAAVLATLVAFGLVAVTTWQTVVTLGGFLVLQGAYSYRLKHILFVDIMAIATGFVLRAYAGLISIDIPFSIWLLLCTGLVSLFLGLGKRRGEAMALGGANSRHRRVLDEYSVDLIDELIGVVAPSILTAYVLYAVLGAKTQLMLLTAPFVIYGIFRVLFLIHYDGSKLPDDPTELVWRDRPLQLCIVLWGVSAGVITLAAA